MENRSTCKKLGKQNYNNFLIALGVRERGRKNLRRAYFLVQVIGERCNSR